MVAGEQVMVDGDTEVGDQVMVVGEDQDMAVGDMADGDQVMVDQ